MAETADLPGQIRDLQRQRVVLRVEPGDQGSDRRLVLADETPLGAA